MPRFFALAIVVSLALGGCGKKDPEEQFALWSNNEAGFAEMAKFVQNDANDVAMRVRALEVLMENGQPSQVKPIASGMKGGDRDKVCAALRDDLAKALKNPNEKIQSHAKAVLMDIIELQKPEEADKTRKLVAEWAFGDMSPDDKAKVIAAKLAKRARRDEIESMGKYGIKGAEIMLSKGIEKPAMLAFLQTLPDPEAKVAMVNGLRRYHGMKGGKVKITPSDLGFLQRTQHIDALNYFFEVYEQRGESDHADDEQASSMAIAAAMQWLDSDEGKKLMTKEWKDNFKPVAVRFMKRAKVEDRFWSAQMMMKYEGVDGLKFALKNLPDDLNYGDGSHNDGDAKLQIRDFCRLDVTKLKQEKVVHALWLETLKEGSLIAQVIALRCLVADGSEDAVDALKDFIKARKKLAAEKIIADLIGAERMPEMLLSDAAAVAMDTLAYKAENAKALEKGKLTADQAKWRNEYAEYSFDRKDKVLRAWCAEMADAKIKKIAAKKADGGDKK